MKRKFLLSTVGLVIAASVFVGASFAAAEGPAPNTGETGTVTPLDSSCSSGHVCVWPEPFYVGTKGESLCTGGAHPLAASKSSGKNSCANKAVYYRQNGTSLVCGNPGSETPNFGFSINEIYVGAEGSRC